MFLSFRPQINTDAHRFFSDKENLCKSFHNILDKVIKENLCLSVDNSFSALPKLND
jgi:hypothetical protein